ncbi:Glycosyl phosphatidyl inositol anchor synthesis [Pleurotus ostreatus]|nr:Glycosyl phosphatidyl inositol anchor synthesis [Pleurotus ostreatus]
MKSPPRSRYNVGFLIAVGLAFHYVYMSSIFDCYFSSTVSNGMSPVTVPSNLAKRLVLIIGDGLRADLLFSLNPFDNIPGSPRIVAPYLRSVMEHSGAFGISHTRVPTLTRPGHVAIIAGMYEDMSTISKGWTSEPVEFDSIFNQSSTTFSLGFPGVQSMFSRRAAPGKIRDWCYEDGEQDYTKDASALDFWVLENLERLFKNSTDDPILSSQLNADKTVFFLRLGGLDVTGHSYRPHSKEYMNNIQAVDRIVERSQSLFNEYFQDSQTSFIFTADHGMSVTGVHGDGHPDNTRTPLIAWGAGIRGPLPDSSPSSHDEYSQPWGLNHLLRRDIEQADITALMATLLGLQWPAHSVGILPDADSSRPGYLALSAGEETVARASLTNANALLEHYRVKHETNQGRRLFYKPFERLEGRADANIAARASMLQRVQTVMDANDWKGVHNESLVLIQAALEGLRYLQTYDSFLIHVIVTAGYVGWAAYSSLYISRPLDQSTSQRATPRASTTVTVLVTLVLCCSWTVFALQHSPWTYYMYITFPCFFWHQFLVQMPWRFIPPAFCYSQCIITALLVFAALQGITLAYAHREIWVYALITAGVIWPPLAWPPNFLKKRVGLYLAWASSCSMIALFHTLPVDAKESLPKM